MTREVVDPVGEDRSMALPIAVQHARRVTDTADAMVQQRSQGVREE